MLGETQYEKLLSSANPRWDWASHIILGTCSRPSAKRCASPHVTPPPYPLGSLNPFQGHRNWGLQSETLHLQQE